MPQGSADSASVSVLLHFGEFREMRLEGHLGKIVEHFGHEVTGLGLFL